MRRSVMLLVAVALGAPAPPCPGQAGSVIDSPHNLSASGPGAVRAASEQQVCVFCHTPHSTAASRPLWNRAMPLVPSTISTSSALDAEPGQPTGASKMCLSCHDGTIALGSVLSRNQVIAMAGGITALPAGAANLGTDLSDDHPISFRYNSALASLDTQLVNPQALPPDLRLDANQELQCTTCHDAHDNSFGDFLVMDNVGSALCLGCHQVGETTIQAHEDCAACHQPHSAPSGPFLLVEPTVSETCLRCHDGSAPTAANILTDLVRVSTHDTNPPIRVSAHGDTSAGTTCTDCHDPHTMERSTSPDAPDAGAGLGRVVTASGAVASFEYEICFQCHGDANTSGVGPWISRQIVQTSTRLQFESTAASFHPVTAPGRNPDVPSLRPGWTEASLVLCSDCHGSNSGAGGGRRTGSGGVHGSDYPPLLVDRYETLDFTPESSAAYALCYRCHERDGFNGILQDRTFPHSVHVVDSRTPCSACHDAHGISSAQGNVVNNSHLINFDTRIVFPDPVTGLLEFVDRGMNSGSCTLSCHGVPHSPLEY